MTTRRSFLKALAGIGAVVLVGRQARRDLIGPNDHWWVHPKLRDGGKVIANCTPTGRSEWDKHQEICFRRIVWADVAEYPPLGFVRYSRVHMIEEWPT